ncbi:MAG TPA: deoxyguanosinetriphosphate triphosphohydrolase, partial [Alphaproteobacteria bacterium]|nr:deoxyguanosinetriphosphate triphosphohydrolase [Alphaproteobacteria bacterium]
MSAPYATQAAASKGRLFKEPESPTRTAYQRDRDRIIHCGAFRRLRNKTQVFIESEGDYFRTRLTHSLEVAQIARTIARVLQVDEDLAEALALAHDMGHTCFGHAGEKALDEAMQPYGGFDHNEQTFRILTQLEKRYASFDGLNLTWDTLEGVVKHNGPLKKLLPTFSEFQKKWDLEFSTHAGIEAQIAALSDDIAYNTHDFDDGFRAGFFKMDALAELPIFNTIVKQTLARYPGIEENRLIQEIVRQAIGFLINDLLEETRHRLAEVKPQNAEQVRKAGKPMVGFSPPVQKSLAELHSFLMNNMYRHGKVNAMNVWAGQMVKGLFESFMNNPARLPPEWRKEAGHSPQLQARLVADYVAGMTDRFAEAEYARLYIGDA